MNTKQLTYPTIKIQEQYWKDKEHEQHCLKEAVSNNATNETRHALGGTCSTCGKVNEIVNQCRCDPNNLPTKLPNETDWTRILAVEAATKLVREWYGIPNDILIPNGCSGDVQGLFDKACDHFESALGVLPQILNGNTSTTDDPKPEELSRTESLTDWYDHRQNAGEITCQP